MVRILPPCLMFSEKEERLEAVHNMMMHIQKDACALIGVYEKNKDGKQEYTGRGWQNNQPIEFYQQEINENLTNIKIVQKEKFLILSHKA